MTGALDRTRRRSITGASQGLAWRSPAPTSQAGASVLLCARDAALLEAGARRGRRARRGPGQRGARPSRRCLAAADDVERLGRGRARRRSRDLQILVNNAGVYGPMGPIEEVDWDAWVQAIEINLFGSILMCRALLPHFKARRYGKIIQLSGGGATNPLPRLSAYAASKAAIVRFAESLALEVEGRRDRRQCHRARRAQHAAARRSARGRPGDVGEAFFERMKQIADEGGTPLETGRGARGVSRIGGERRHHRQAAQRGVGSVGRRCRRTATT